MVRDHMLRFVRQTIFFDVVYYIFKKRKTKQNINHLSIEIFGLLSVSRFWLTNQRSKRKNSFVMDIEEKKEKHKTTEKCFDHAEKVMWQKKNDKKMNSTR